MSNKSTMCLRCQKTYCTSSAVGY